MTRTLKNLMTTMTPEQILINELEEDIIVLKKELDKQDFRITSMWNEMIQTQNTLKNFLEKLAKL